MKFRGEYAFLSNMSSYGFRVDGLWYPTVEHFFQSMKTEKMFQRENIRICKSPVLAKQLGRKVDLRVDWNDIRIEIMCTRLVNKFTQNPALLKKLLDIKTDIIEENTWHDSFWGTYNGAGRNELGKLLMKIRKYYRGK